MRRNENTIVKGKHVVLVPYKSHHVPTYHDWMQSPFLQEVTASEPLTLEEEYEMQKQWHEDEDKCTFIIVLPGFQSKHPDGNNDSEGGMIGDVNLFLSEDAAAEVEIMIAEEQCRRKGYGLEAVVLMLKYGIQELNLKRFIVKIGLKNASSVALFEQKLGFRRIHVSEVFQEVELERLVDLTFLDLLESLSG